MKTISIISIAAILSVGTILKDMPAQSENFRDTLKKIPVIHWDTTTLTRISSAIPGVRYSGYARMIQLKDNSLLTIYEAGGNIVCVKSHDLGKTWSEAIYIAQKEEGVNMSVPDVLELKDRTLLACYNPRPYQIDPKRRFSIRTKRSKDGGKTWLDERLVYQAGYQFENGCWEPSAIQLPTGEIQLYFADEAPYTNSNEQNISMLRSVNGGLTWSKTPEIISFRVGKRDGMPVPLLLKNGRKIVFSIEDNGSGNFKPYVISSFIKDNWKKTVDAKSINRNYALMEHLDTLIYAGAPFLRQLKTGETILSYQGTEGRINKMENAEMKVVIGDDNAVGFGQKTIPFKIPADKYGLWNSLCVLSDNTIVALTSTNAWSRNTEVWMIKGHLNTQKIALADPTIFHDRGRYYLYGTSSNRGFEVYQSDDLSNWTGPVGKKEGLALKKGDSYGSSGFWAPQVFGYRNAYYMAYTANEEIAIARSDSPLGPFRQQKLKALSGEGKQIDPFIFFDPNGKIYLYHVKLKEGNRIYVAEMKPDLSDVIPGSSKACIVGDTLWENTEKTPWPVTEGPTVIKHKNLYYMIYSANDFRSKDYAVGYATSTSPLGPWKKYAGNPIISRTKLGENGTGHGDLFRDNTGNYKYVLHTHYSSEKVSPRPAALIDMRFQPVEEGEDRLIADEQSFYFLRKK